MLFTSESRLRRGVALSTLLISLPLAAEETLSTVTLHGLDPVAPLGRWVLKTELRSVGFNYVYDQNGDRKPLGDVFDGVALDANVFPALLPLGPGATLGTTSLANEVRIERMELTLGYGLTENLTAGIILPIGNSYTSTDFSVANGNVGWNPSFDPAAPMSESNFPFAPVGAGADAPLGTADVQRILTDPAFGFGYREARDSSTEQLADPTLGMLWRFHEGARGKAALGLGWRFGVVEDDPDDLFDVPLDDGNDDLIVQLEYFREIGTGFDMRALAKRTVQMPDRVDMRVPGPGTLLAPAATKEDLGRDLGDFWEYDLELGRAFGAWRVSGTWHRWDKARDRYTSGRGQDTSTLETHTDILADQWRAAVSWSGINGWRQGRLPLPLIVKFAMQETYSGRNMNDVRDLYMIVTAMF